MIQKHITEFKNLDPEDLYNLLKLRQDVFIIEQNCIYDDIDQIDLHSEHVLLYDENNLAAYSRIVPSGVKFDEVSIGRIVVNPAYRKKGLGRTLLANVLAILKERNTKTVKIEAQKYLQNFYENAGFDKISEPYEVDGIVHIQMVTHLK